MQDQQGHCRGRKGRSLLKAKAQLCRNLQPGREIPRPSRLAIHRHTYTHTSHVNTDHTCTPITRAHTTHTRPSPHPHVTCSHTSQGAHHMYTPITHAHIARMHTLRVHTWRGHCGHPCSRLQPGSLSRPQRCHHDGEAINTGPRASACRAAWTAPALCTAIGAHHPRMPPRLMLCSPFSFRASWGASDLLAVRGTLGVG